MGICNVRLTESDLWGTKSRIRPQPLTTIYGMNPKWKRRVRSCHRPHSGVVQFSPCRFARATSPVCLVMDLPTPREIELEIALRKRDAQVAELAVRPMTTRERPCLLGSHLLTSFLTLTDRDFTTSQVSGRTAPTVHVGPYYVTPYTSVCAVVACQQGDVEWSTRWVLLLKHGQCCVDSTRTLAPGGE